MIACGIPALCHLLTSCVLLTGAAQLVKGEIILETPFGVEVEENGDLVVDHGSEFSLTCRGDKPVHWMFNHNDPDPSEVGSSISIRPSDEYGQYISKLTVQNAYYMDTGYFYCLPESAKSTSSPFAKSIYVYVKDPAHVLAVNSTYELRTVTNGQKAEIPCRPTDPKLNVTLKKDDEEVIRDFHPHVGFTFTIYSVHEGGEYKCCVNENECIIWQIYVHIETHSESIEKPHVGNQKQIVTEGMNVTLNCSVHHPFGTTIFLNWTTPNPNIQRTEQPEAESNNVREEGKVHQHLGTRQLIIYKVNKKDEGNYTCNVYDNSGNENFNTVELVVHKEGKKLLNLSVRGQKDNAIMVNPNTQDVTVIVDIESFPKIKNIIWYDHNNVMIKNNSHHTIINSESTSRLFIMKPDVEYSGNYTLVAKNKFLEKNISIAIEVIGIPKLKIKIPVSNVTGRGFYINNQVYDIECDVYASPKARVSWLFTPCDMYPTCSTEQQKIKQAQELVLDSFTKSTVQIVANRTGELACTACNKFGCKNTSTTILLSDVRDGFFLEGQELVVESDNVTLKCVASKYDFNNNITWSYCNEGTCSSRNDVEVHFEETKLSYISILNIRNVTKNFTGNYFCIVNHRHKRNVTKHHHYYMDVVELLSPKIKDDGKSNKRANKTGSPEVLQCEATGMPPPTVLWYKNDIEVSKLGKPNLHLSYNNITLRVDLGIDDDGIYKCVATNKIGETTKEYIIEVIDKPPNFLYICLVYILPLAFIVGLLVAVTCYWRIYKLKQKMKELSDAGLLNFEEGNIESLNPEINIGEQADLLPYDKKWEFSRDKLKMGKQLGAGAFGVVMKAEAYEIAEKGVATTVAVKMVKRNSDAATIKALVSELKIMIHLGKHLNVVNLLGACTGGYNKRELLVLVEYCQYGNLHQYLLKHRGAFINQVNPKTGTFDPTVIQPMSPISPGGQFFGNGDSAGMSLRTSAAYSAATDTTLIMSDMSTHIPSQTNGNNEVTPEGNDGYLVSRGHEWRNSDRGDYKENLGLKPVCTQDLICWGFQIARGMEYLSSRKVLHGDLAARNVLLAEDNIVKICDFGLSKSMYRDDNYQKKGDAKLPVKWMALESIRDRVFSTQSDVWSYGVTLWELFSLSVTPYPGMEVDERLLIKLENGYRMEKSKYATNQVYKVMMDCWHENPHTRPSFTELVERMGGMLEDTIRSHYVDLNDPYLQENSEYLAQRDYLSMLNSPSYANWSPNGPGPYLTMKSPRDPVEDVELTPMLKAGGTPPHSPDGLTKPIGNNYVNVAQMLSFSNPSYHNVGRPKQTPYVNMPDR